MPESTLGSSVPPFTAHAISVSLPTWKDNVEYEQGSKRVVDAMVNGYPRFFIHLSIRKLATICEQKFGLKDERCLLFPTKRIAEQCRSFMQDQSSQSIQPRLIHLLICPEDTGIVNLTTSPPSPTSPTTTTSSPAAVSSSPTSPSADLHIVLFPADAFPLAKQFWQHTGQGISSRQAEYCLSMLPESKSTPLSSSLPPSPTATRFPTKTKGPNRHYGVKGVGVKPSSPNTNHTEFVPATTTTTTFGSSTTATTEKKPVAVGVGVGAETANPDSVYLEERYGRNLPLTSAADAKRAMRRRLAGVLRDGDNEGPGGVSLRGSDGPQNSCANAGPGPGPGAEGVLRDRDSHSHSPQNPCAGPGTSASSGPHDLPLPLIPSSRGVSEVTETDVFLYPTGMAAVWNAHQLALAVMPPAKSVCFGFPYIDTLKILEKWGPGCYFLGHGLDSDIDELERILAAHPSTPSPSTPSTTTQSQSSPSTQSSPFPTTEPTSSTPTPQPPLLSLFTEFPSNPLLRSANLPRLRLLADKHAFLIIIDETLGNLVNVEILQYADVVVSSLSKVFSGESNVMGGSLVLNPQSPYYPLLKAHLTATYEDFYFNEDAIYMERNSRDFERRTRVINGNAERVCGFLRGRSLMGGGGGAGGEVGGGGGGGVGGGASSSRSPVIKEVFYPKWTTRENYEHCRIKSSVPGSSSSSGGSNGEGGFGGLFSLTFTSLLASQTFFDTLRCHKGPSLGTNFTLASPFTILAHFGELEWAGGYGVEEGLVRVSVGMEDGEWLLGVFGEAVGRAEEVVGRVGDDGRGAEEKQ